MCFIVGGEKEEVGSVAATKDVNAIKLSRLPSANLISAVSHESR